jgi:DNA repair protein RecO (recombination protein O)
MPLRESEAIVLRSFPLGEADRLVSFLTRTWGRVRGVARGARRPKSRFGSTLEPLTHIRICYYERETRELVRISSADIVESFLAAQADYDASVALALVAEVTEAVLPDHEPSDAAFRLVLHVARAIRDRRTTGLPLAYFALWTVRLGGWLGDLERCSRCRRELAGGAAFGSASSPGLACPKCRYPGMRTIPAAGLAAASRMLAEPLDRLMELAEPLGGTRDLRAWLLDVIEHQIERRLASRLMLDQIPESKA